MAVAQEYSLTGRSWGWAIAAGVWTLVCDAALKAFGRAAGCDSTSVVQGLKQLWSTPDGCQAVPLAGDGLVLNVQAHPGALFGVARDSLEPAMGQVLALGLVALAALATILVLRWKHRASSDPSALALIWAGALGFAVPRLVASTGLSEIDVAGIPTGVAELALAFGLLWLGVRVIGEIMRS